jgi:ubiquinone/menaquinone biosynthesis C-methylase UbiE
MAVESLPPPARQDPAWIERQAAHARAYDAIGSRYDETFPHKEGQLACVESLLDRLPPGARVLDVGAGTGLPTARQLVAAGCEVTCLDISLQMLEIAQVNVPGANFLHGDVLDIPDRPDQYDAVTAFFSLLHLPRTRVRTALRLLHRVLDPSGWLALGMVEIDLDDVPFPFLGSVVRGTGFLRDDLRTVLRHSGFGVEQEQVVSYVVHDPSATEPETQMYFLCRRVNDPRSQS